MDRDAYTQSVKRLYASYHHTAPGFNARVGDLEFSYEEGQTASFTVSIYFALAAHSYLPLLLNALTSEGFPVREYMDNFASWLPVNNESQSVSVTLHCAYDFKTKSGLTLPPGSGITLFKLVKAGSDEGSKWWKTFEDDFLATKDPESAHTLANLCSIGLGIKSKVRPLADLAPLTQREIEVVVAVADGYSNIQISQNLNISSKTVERHKTSIYKKLGLCSSVDLVKYAIKKGLISI